MSSDFIDVERWDPKQGRFVKSSPEEMMSEQDAVEQLRRSLKALRLEVPKSVADDVEKHAEVVISSLEAGQQENERLRARQAEIEAKIDEVEHSLRNAVSAIEEMWV